MWVAWSFGPSQWGPLKASHPITTTLFFAPRTPPSPPVPHGHPHHSSDFLGCSLPLCLYLFNHLQAGTTMLFHGYLWSTHHVQRVF